MAIEKLDAEPGVSPSGGGTEIVALPDAPKLESRVPSAR
jgi:hypothetical protein